MKNGDIPLNRDRDASVVIDTNLGKTVVLLCAELQSLGHGLDLPGVQGWLQEMLPAVRVDIVSNLGLASQAIGRAIATHGAKRLVLGLCSGNRATAKVQAQARESGLDPLGIEVINLGAQAALTHSRPQATERAKILLAAAVARARAFSRSGPENLKPYLPTKMSRRSLFSLPVLEYRAVPSVRSSRCAVRAGCELCVGECPCNAIAVTESRISLDKSRCEGCGACVAACPREAIHFPGYTPPQLAAQISALLDPAIGSLQPRGILLVCERSRLVLDKLASGRFADSESGSQVVDPSASSVDLMTGLLPVSVPCLGMLPPAWLLGCLVQGAAAVGLFAYPGRCPFDQQEVIAGRVAYCRELLRLLGDSPEKVRLLRVADLGGQRSGVQEQQKRIGLRSPAPSRVGAPSPAVLLSYTSRAAAKTILSLAGDNGAAAGISLAHPHSPFGVVEVTDGCTGCEVCAGACPTGALDLEREEGNLSLTFDPALCTACAQCLSRCPEAANQVLHLQRITDLQRLSQGRVVVFQSRQVRCEACGGPIASEAMLKRMEEALGEQNAGALRVIRRYCPDCRVLLGSVGTGVPPERGASLTHGQRLSGESRGGQ